MADGSKTSPIRFYMAAAEDRGEKRGRAAEREKAEAQMAVMEAQMAAMEAERITAVSALRAAGVSEDIIEKACSDA